MAYILGLIAVAVIVATQTTEAQDLERGDINSAIKQAFEQQAELVARLEAAYQNEADRSDSIEQNQTTGQE